MTDNTNKQLKGNQLSFDAGIKNFKADGSDVVITLVADSFHYGDAILYLAIDTHLSERVDVINLTNMPIKQSTVKQLKKDQQKHGYKELTTMVADVLEKHYEKD